MIKYLKEKHKEDWIAKKDAYWVLWANLILAEKDPATFQELRNSQVPPISLVTFFEPPNLRTSTENFLSQQNAANFVAVQAIEVAIVGFKRQIDNCKNNIAALKALKHSLSDSIVASENQISREMATLVREQADVDHTDNP